MCPVRLDCLVVEQHAFVQTFPAECPVEPYRFVVEQHVCRAALACVVQRVHALAYLATALCDQNLKGCKRDAIGEGGRNEGAETIDA